MPTDIELAIGSLYKLLGDTMDIPQITGRLSRDRKGFRGAGKRIGGKEQATKKLAKIKRRGRERVPG